MFIKYPRTPHLEGSRLQPGDTSDDQVSMFHINSLDCDKIWEEKIDGANTGISFTDSDELQLQSRGHVLLGGHRENQFNLFKSWATAKSDDFYCILGRRYIMYGEWCYAKHSVFYDALPHYFMEFDIYDKEDECWLDTPTRHKMLEHSGIHSVPVVHTGPVNSKNLMNLVKPSLYKTPGWRESMAIQALRHDLDPVRIANETDKEDQSEGLYLKCECFGRVIGRYKFIRPSFVQTIIENGTHWSDRPILPNLTIMDIFNVI